MKSLEKNSNKHFKRFQIGRILFMFNIADYMDVPFIFRKFAIQTTPTIQRETYFGIFKMYFEDDTFKATGYNITIGPFSLTIGILPT
jgi:hypothetical protein